MRYQGIMSLFWRHLFDCWELEDSQLQVLETIRQVESYRIYKHLELLNLSSKLNELKHHHAQALMLHGVEILWWRITWGIPAASCKIHINIFIKRVIMFSSIHVTFSLSSTSYAVMSDTFIIILSRGHRIHLLVRSEYNAQSTIKVNDSNE